MENMAPKIRDHLTLLYAIQTRDPLVAGTFPDKKIMLTNDTLKMLEEATNLVLEHLGEVKVVPFSMRLEKRALQLASAITLMKYFNSDSDVIPIDEVAARMAVQFFVEEAWVRSNEAFPLFEVLKKLALK
jgi:phosphatidylglycerophosphatase A